MIRSSKLPTGGMAYYQTHNGRQKRRRERLVLGLAIMGVMFSAAVVQQMVNPARAHSTAPAYAYFNH